ncbi:hypothetical protein PLICRDRAFT_38849 [Plicaturopsis crispa FD-325 SS-3]|nr:hypothetical protein PLICRDRAFT_38849 [Plicaturopsis crispa FD-325 SS-3]
MSSEVLPPPPAGLNYTAVIGPSLSFLLLGTVFSSLLISIFIALLFFSDSKSRKRPIFVLNVLAVLLGVAEGAVNINIEIRTMLFPDHPVPLSTKFAFVILAFIGPLSVECVLLFRIATVFPPTTEHAKRKLAAILAFPILSKTARLVNFGLFMLSIPTVFLALQIEWILQLVEHSYVVLIFSYRLRSRQSTTETMEVIRSARMSRRIRGLLLIAISNFIFPVVLNVVQLILLIGKTKTNGSFIRMALVFVANTYVTIIGVVFATVWSTGSSWAHSQGLVAESAADRYTQNTFSMRRRSRRIQPNLTDICVDRDSFSPSHKYSFARSPKGDVFELVETRGIAC